MLSPSVLPQAPAELAELAELVELVELAELALREVLEERAEEVKGSEKAAMRGLREVLVEQVGFGALLVFRAPCCLESLSHAVLLPLLPSLLARLLRAHLPQAQMLGRQGPWRLKEQVSDVQILVELPKVPQAVQSWTVRL